MDDVITSLPAAGAGLFDLGEMLGQRHAFNMVAGRCSAADANCLRRIRDEKLYLHRSPTWDEFCPKHLGLSKSHANRIIRWLDELGPDYFELAQLTRITPKQFRAIAPAVRGNKIHVNGEVVALIPENSEKVAAALEELRRAAAPEPGTPLALQDRLIRLEHRFDRAVADLGELARSATPDEAPQLAAVVENTLDALRRLGFEFRA